MGRKFLLLTLKVGLDNIKNSGKDFVYGVLYDSHDEEYDSAWDLRTVYRPFKKICFECWCHNIDELNSTETKHTHVFECMPVTVVCGLFVEICWLFTLFHMVVLWRNLFSQTCFSKNRMTSETQKKSENHAEKRELGKDIVWWLLLLRVKVI